MVNVNKPLQGEVERNHKSEKNDEFHDGIRSIGKHKAAWRATIQFTVKFCRDFAFGFHPPLSFSSRTADFTVDEK